jgi:hypothetical protein
VTTGHSEPYLTKSDVRLRLPKNNRKTTINRAFEHTHFDIFTPDSGFIGQLKCDNVGSSDGLACELWHVSAVDLHFSERIWLQNLELIETSYGCLVYLAGLLDPDTGRYEHYSSTTMC